MSQVSNSRVGQTPSLIHSIPSDTAMNHPWGYGGTIPEENMIKIATPKEHPYSSHISRFAMFPSFRSPDDPETGVRAASQPFFNPHIPNSAPEVTVQSKTMGNPYRHEILQSPAKSSRKAVAWTGDHGFLDPLKGEKQVFYPTPPKTVLPNLKLRDPHLSLSERTSNMLKNLERTFWLTSYQMDYTGWGPANPLKMDDFQEKISSLPGINPHRTPLFDEGLIQKSMSQNSQEVNAAQISKTEASLNVCSRPYSQGKVSTREKGWVELDEARDKANIAPNAEVLSRASLEQDSLTEGKQLLPPTSNPSILPRPLPGIRSTSQAGAVGGAGGAVSILELQNSFSKSEAHRNFNRSITHAAVDLRDNIVTGKKHNFFGINCNYIHG
uniref:Uncharacterized protein n=1 Tax=Salarias fasciatus TaxID=181472 RepID=A0A672I3I7_SALFA